MPEIKARELRNDVSEVLRRVERGERLTVTVSGRPVALMVPLATRPKTIPWAVLASAVGKVSADSGLRTELGEVLEGTTDDVA